MPVLSELSALTHVNANTPNTVTCMTADGEGGEQGFILMWETETESIMGVIGSSC